MWLESTAKGQRITSTPVVSWSVVDSGGGGERQDLEAGLLQVLPETEASPDRGWERPRLYPQPPPAPAQAPSYTLAFGADGAAFVRGDFGVRTVLEVHRRSRHRTARCRCRRRRSGRARVSRTSRSWYLRPFCTQVTGGTGARRGDGGLQRRAARVPHLGAQAPQPHRPFPSVLEAHLDFPFPAFPFFVLLFFLSPNP